VVVKRATPSGARGLTLVELLLAMVISTIVFSALTSVVFVALRSQSSGAVANEQVYLTGFALERLVLKTRSAPPKPLAPAAGNTTGNWLAPLAFCFSAAGRRLMETIDTDSTCSSGVVVADNVTAFSAQIAASTRPVDAPVIVYSLTVAPPAAPQPITLSASVRLGGGLQ
jgi:prepilin-type N-terminal cleavage/methylation domain-containing protein